MRYKSSLRSAFWAVAFSAAATSAFACPTDGTNTGTIKASVVGIEVMPNCTYVMIKNVTTTLPEVDTAPFMSGRFAYIALDPTSPSYKAMLAVASMAAATNSRIYADVVSRTARANRLSIANEENNNQ